MTDCFKQAYISQPYHIPFHSGNVEARIILLLGLSQWRVEYILDNVLHKCICKASNHTVYVSSAREVLYIQKILHPYYSTLFASFAYVV